MFDTAKVQRMTFELEQFARQHTEIYVIPEWLTPDAFALFRRMRISVRAVIINQPTAQKEIFGCPVMTMAEMIRNLTTRTGIIHLSAKPQPALVNVATFTIGNQQLNVPLFAIGADEILAIYDRLTLIKVLQQYQEDGLSPSTPQALAIRFARGLTTFLNPTFQNFKYQLWDRREHFNPRYDFDDTAIVIQGPLVYENNYTAETFKLYRSIYPNVPIVVSTWKGEAMEAFREECEKNSVALLENELPNDRGFLNVNLQLESSHRGVDYAQKNTSARFVLKTRSDQRINRFDFLVYFKNLLETFPPKGDKLQERIILLSSFASKTMPFFFNDFLSFGHLLDISRLYGIPLHQAHGEMTYFAKHFRRMLRVQGMLTNDRCPTDYNSVTVPNRKIYGLNKMMLNFCNPEVYIARTFYRKYVAPLNKTKLLETSWKFTRDYLVLIDGEAISLDWFKYNDNRCYSYHDSKGQSAFSRWLDMYRNFNVDWV